MTIVAVRSLVDLLIIGIYKVKRPGSDVFITPDMESAVAVINAGADIVALDCTNRLNYNGEYGTELIGKIREISDILIMAEISVLDEAVTAYNKGVDVIATTLSGDTAYSRRIKEPDFELIKEIRAVLPNAFINAEGRISTPAELKYAFDCGADMVTVGTAITRPQWITKRFTEVLV